MIGYDPVVFLFIWDKICQGRVNKLRKELLVGPAFVLPGRVGNRFLLHFSMYGVMVLM